MAIKVSKRSLKKAFQKHFAAYQLLKLSNDTRDSRMLLLTYCTEAGLKFLILDARHIFVMDKADSRSKDLYSHDLEKLMKEAHIPGSLAGKYMPSTSEKEQVHADTLHEALRYSAFLSPDKNETMKLNELENNLMEIAKTIQERI